MPHWDPSSDLGAYLHVSFGGYNSNIAIAPKRRDALPFIEHCYGRCTRTLLPASSLDRPVTLAACHTHTELNRTLACSWAAVPDPAGRYRCQLPFPLQFLLATVDPVSACQRASCLLTFTRLVDSPDWLTATPMPSRFHLACPDTAPCLYAWRGNWRPGGTRYAYWMVVTTPVNWCTPLLRPKCNVSAGLLLVSA